MRIQGPNPSGASANQPAAALGLATSSILNKVTSTAEARALPSGSLVGDLHGGLTFTDAVAAVLESRSNAGWREITVDATIWTVIRIDR